METKDIIARLRTQQGLSQEELAQRVSTSRQTVMYWENGDAVPGPEAMKQLSKLFDVSIHSLLGARRRLVCQCCGMSLSESSMSREPDGTRNEDYCRWCYRDGKFLYNDLDELTDFLVEQLSDKNWPPEQVREYLQTELPRLEHWKV